MAQKKRAKRKGKTGAQLSGNPAKQALQLEKLALERENRALRETAPRTKLDPASVPGLGLGLGDTAGLPWYTGFADPETRRWWPASYDAIADAAGDQLRSLSTPRELEAATHAIVGDEWFRRLRREDGGQERAGWLRGLIDRLRTLVRQPTPDDDALGPWLLLRGLSLGGVTEPGNDLDYPALPDGLRWLTGPVELRVTGDPLLLRDAYGARMGLFAPFDYRGDAVDPDPHWYAWDFDQCTSPPAILAAGSFDDLESAVEDWTSAVGPAAPADAEPRPCSPTDVFEILEELELQPVIGEAAYGSEPPELCRELARMRARADILSDHLDRVDGLAPADGTVADEPTGWEDTLQDFVAWHERIHGAKPEWDDAATILDEWVEADAPPRVRLACSPHRIRHATIVIQNGIVPEHVPEVMALLPAWVEWCLERTGVDDELAERSRAATQRAVAAEKPAEGWDAWEPGPYRRPE